MKLSLKEHEELHEELRRLVAEALDAPYHEVSCEWMARAYQALGREVPQSLREFLP